MMEQVLIGAGIALFIVFMAIVFWHMNIAIVGAGCDRVPYCKITDIDIGTTLVTVVFNNGSPDFLGEVKGKYSITNHWPVRLLRVTKSKVLFERDLRKYQEQGFIVIPDGERTKYIPIELVKEINTEHKEFLIDE